MKKSALIILASLFCLASLGNDALAGNGKGKGNGNGKGRDGEHQEREHGHNDHDNDHGGHSNSDDLISILIGDRDRDAIRHYLADDHHKHCPPGLAKKHNGCMPPGLAKKYKVGERLPDGIYIPLPDALRDLLSPPPRGYEYVQVDKDVLLIGEASKKVIDAVTLLSAVGE